MKEYLKESVVSGVVSVVRGVAVTVGASLSVPTPWDLKGILIAVGLASFFSGLGSSYGAS